MTQNSVILQDIAHQIGVLTTQSAKGWQVHLLCVSLVAMLKVRE
jgi:hypothetical protein